MRSHSTQTRSIFISDEYRCAKVTQRVCKPSDRMLLRFSRGISPRTTKRFFSRHERKSRAERWLIQFDVCTRDAVQSSGNDVLICSEKKKKQERPTASTRNGTPRRLGVRSERSSGAAQKRTIFAFARRNPGLTDDPRKPSR